MAIAILGGLLLGAIGGPVWVLPIWAAVAAACGLAARSRRAAITAGLTFGFVVSFVFLVRGYAGVEPLVSRLPFFAALGLFGACCGGVISGVASLLLRDGA
jgi:hypothetical protein